MVSTPKMTGTPVSSDTRDDPGGALPRHEVEMGGVTADDRAEADDRVALPRGGEALGDERDLERAGHPVHGDVVETAGAQHPERALEQRPRDVVVEPARHHRDAHAGGVEHALVFLVGAHDVSF